MTANAAPAAEGLIGVALAPAKGVLVEVNSETDFVARNDLFQGLVKTIANVALDVGADLDKILGAKVGDRTVADAISETIAKIGENMTLRRATSLAVGRGVVANYMHNSQDEGLGRIGVILTLESAGKADELKAIGRMVAMHVASANPQAVEPSGLDAATIERERNILADKAKSQGKPANVVEKIVESGLKTFYKDVCLLEQPFIFDDKKTVAQALKEAEGAAGGPIRIGGYVRFALSEGIEKQESDFAAGRH
jgi:elongation factor Ts